jgi:hypothetical protein
MVLDLRYFTHEVAPNHSQEVLQFRQTVSNKDDCNLIEWSDWKDVPHVFPKE